MKTDRVPSGGCALLPAGSPPLLVPVPSACTVLLSEATHQLLPGRILTASLHTASPLHHQQRSVHPLAAQDHLQGTAVPIRSWDLAHPFTALQLLGSHFSITGSTWVQGTAQGQRGAGRALGTASTLPLPPGFSLPSCFLLAAQGPNEHIRILLRLVLCKHGCALSCNAAVSLPGHYPLSHTPGVATHRVCHGLGAPCEGKTPLEQPPLSPGTAPRVLNAALLTSPSHQEPPSTPQHHPPLP